MKATRVLIIEDSRDIARYLRLELAHEGYEADVASTGTEGLAKALEGGFALVLLDVMLPELNGLEVLRRLRRDERTRTLPIIMLTARDTVMDKVGGLDAGANDYITKPFHIEELLARIRVLLRHHDTQSASGESLTVRDVVIEPASRRVTRGENDIQLTKTQFDLLHHLARNRGVVLTRDKLLTEVWGYEYQGDSNVVDVCVKGIRAKLGDTSIIETVRGVGYVVRG